MIVPAGKQEKGLIMARKRLNKKVAIISSIFFMILAVFAVVLILAVVSCAQPETETAPPATTEVAVRSSVSARTIAPAVVAAVRLSTSIVSPMANYYGKVLLKISGFNLPQGTPVEQSVQLWRFGTLIINNP